MAARVLVPAAGAPSAGAPAAAAPAAADADCRGLDIEAE